MKVNSNAESASPNDEKINLREVLRRYLFHWKLFLLSIMIAVVSAFIYLRFATYEYEVSSTILINDEDNDGGSTSEISTFQDLGLFVGPKTSLDTEMGVLKSKTLIETVIKELGLNITYYIKSGLALDEVYRNDMPFNINLFANDAKLSQLDTVFSISAISTTQFALSDSNGDKVSEGLFGERISGDFGDFVATPIDVDNVEIGEKILIKISPLEDVAINLKKRIEVVPDNLKSNLLILSLQDPIKSKAKDILDNLVLNYNKDAIEYKGQVAKSTDEFIAKRIDDISVELTSLDQGVETYKTRNKLSNMDSEAGLVLASNAQLANQIGELSSQIKLIEYVTDYMKTNKDGLIPANLGLLNQSASQNTINYNNLLLERKRLLAGANKENPVVLNLDKQITSLRESIDRSLINTRSSLEISLQEAKLQESRLTSKIFATPKKEREIRDIQRQQEIIETLYLYLLQKREENSISLAVTSPNAKIVDRAYGSNTPVAPRKMIVLVASLLLGFLIPAALIIFRSLFDNKVHTLEELEGIVNIPILGEIPTNRVEKSIVDFGLAKNNVAESFRLLRTNIIHLFHRANTETTYDKREGVQATPSNVMFVPTIDDLESQRLDVASNTSKPRAAKIIFVSSTMRKEGRTFVALNLAISLALLNKKTLLIEADLRNPGIGTSLGTKKQKGLVHLLTNPTLPLTDVITTHKETNLDVLEAGIVPSNPAELLANDRFGEILIQCKQNYDYVVIDNSSVNTASDTLMLGHHADLFIYVVRANFLDKKMLQIPTKIFENKRLPNLAILMNGTGYEKSGYDSEHRFGEEQIKKSWIDKLLK